MDLENCLYCIASDVSIDEYAAAVEGLNNYYCARLRGTFEPQLVGSRGLAGDAYADELAIKLTEKLAAL
jgi:hypothetical protein